jgi:hypothetical protein
MHYRFANLFAISPSYMLTNGHAEANWRITATSLLSLQKGKWPHEKGRKKADALCSKSTYAEEIY